MSLTAGQWAALFETALRERAEIENRIAEKWFGHTGVFEPFFPGFLIRTATGDVSYHLCCGGLPTISAEVDATKPLGVLLAAVARAGLTVEYVAKPQASWASLFGRKVIGVQRFYRDRPHEVFFTVSHELAHFVLHRKRPKDPEMIERETHIVEGFLMKKCVEPVESVRPIYVTLRRPVPDDFEFLAIEYRPAPYVPPVRTKRQLLASRERILNAAAMIEDLFREAG